MKKVWIQPEVVTLGVKATNNGGPNGVDAGFVEQS